MPGPAFPSGNWLTASKTIDFVTFRSGYLFGELTGAAEVNLLTIFFLRSSPRVLFWRAYRISRGRIWDIFVKERSFTSKRVRLFRYFRIKNLPTFHGFGAQKSFLLLAFHCFGAINLLLAFLEPFFLRSNAKHETDNWVRLRQRFFGDHFRKCFDVILDSSWIHPRLVPFPTQESPSSSRTDPVPHFVGIKNVR